MNSTIFKLPPSIYVYHMESDRLIPGQIFYSDILALHTTKGSNITDVFNFWAAYRTGISAFTQTSEYDIVFLDNDIHCLRLYNRLQDTVKKLGDSCDNRYLGFGDGTYEHVPMKVIKDNQDPSLLYVIDFSSHALRMVTKTHIPHVTTLMRNDHKRYTGLTQEPEGRYLYITYFEGLERYDLVRNTSRDIVSRSTRYTNHALMYDGQFNGIALLKNWVIISDSSADLLFVVDLTNNTTFTICTGIAGHSSGNASFCQLKSPRNLLELNGDIYIEGERHISMLRGTT